MRKNHFFLINRVAQKPRYPVFVQKSAKKRIKNQKVNNKITPPILGGCNFEAEIATPEKTKKQKLHTALLSLSIRGVINIFIYMV